MMWTWRELAEGAAFVSVDQDTEGLVAVITGAYTTILIEGVDGNFHEAGGPEWGQTLFQTRDDGDGLYGMDAAVLVDLARGWIRQVAAHYAAWPNVDDEGMPL